MNPDSGVTPELIALMIDERPQCLILECGDPRVQLVPASGIRSARNDNVAIGSGQRDVIDGWNCAPNVHERFGGWLVGRGVDELDIGRQRERDPDQSIPPKRREIGGVCAM